MAKAQVKFLCDHVHVSPETTIDSYVGDVKVSSIPAPEKRLTYTKDQVVDFRSKKDAKAFAAAHGSEVCVVL